MRKALATFILALLTSVLVGVQHGGLASAQFFESVTIKPDGSVEPSNAPIKQNDDIYTLTEDINALSSHSPCLLNGKIGTFS